MTTAGTRPTRRTALALVALGAPLTLAACGGGPRVQAPISTAMAGDFVFSERARVTARGPFEGRSNHQTDGHASIVFDGGKVFIVLEEDFAFDGAPDPKVGLGNRGFDPGSLHGPLSSDSGRQIYELKPGLDIGDYFQVWIWCEQFDVPLGVAELTLT
ncbi:MAG: DM13 domain-containing protein [Pseudomonadota bacterium]